MNTPATVAPIRNGLTVRIAERYGVDPDKMLNTLKATAFKQANNAEISNEQMMALLVVADQYKLNPFTRELFAFPDKGGIVPIVSIDGWARIVNEHQQFDGVHFLYDTDDDNFKWCKCILFRRDRAHPIEVTEYLKECKRDTGPWRSHPRRMLRHKAFIQCARLAFGFAGIYDEDEAQRIIEKDITPETSSVENTRNLLRNVTAQTEVPTVIETDTDFVLTASPVETPTASEAGVSSDD